MKNRLLARKRKKIFVQTSSYINVSLFFRFCNKPFRDGGTLRKHLRIHTGDRPHVCPLCERSFNQKVVMREHIRWVHAASTVEYPEPPAYACLLCTTQTPLMDREDLCMHILTHSDQITSIRKRMDKLKQTLDLDTTSASTIQMPNNIVAVPGLRCNLKVIQKNRQILGYIDRFIDRNLDEVKVIPTESEDPVAKPDDGGGTSTK